MPVTRDCCLSPEQNREELRVRVKLCGNCNPYTDAGKILHYLGQADHIRILFGDSEKEDVFLSINGCDRACTASYAGSAGLVISGRRFGGIEYRDERTLTNAVIEALRNYK